MSSKPEASFIRSVHKYIPKELYTEGMANPYRGGTPDRYYEGNNGVLWVEYKYFPKLPPVIELTSPKAKVKLSKLQEDWLRRAYNNGLNVAVIAGCPDGGIIFSGISWDAQWLRAEAVDFIRPRKEVAEWISSQCINWGSLWLQKAKGAS